MEAIHERHGPRHGVHNRQHRVVVVEGSITPTDVGVTVARDVLDGGRRCLAHEPEHLSAVANEYRHSFLPKGPVANDFARACERRADVQVQVVRGRGGE